jgi:hypothetical protein
MRDRVGRPFAGQPPPLLSAHRPRLDQVHRAVLRRHEGEDAGPDHRPDDCGIRQGGDALVDKIGGDLTRNAGCGDPLQLLSGEILVDDQLGLPGPGGELDTRKRLRDVPVVIRGERVHPHEFVRSGREQVPDSAV